jgi:hypothetical protein
MKTEMKAMQGKPTPTPWVENAYRIFGNHQSEFVCILATNNEGRTPKAKANAAFILRAVNNFDSLLKTLRVIAEYESSTEGIKKISLIAIAKAEGR